MKDITVSIDEDTYRRIHVKAAEQDTSASELVSRFLSELAAGEKDTERLKRDECALRARIVAFRASDCVSREDAHGRGA